MRVWSCVAGSQTRNAHGNTRETCQQIRVISVGYCKEQENVKRKWEIVAALFTLENYPGQVLQ